MILIEFGPNLCTVILYCLIAVMAFKALEYIKFMYLKDKYPDYGDEEESTYVA
ncbi:hypothetical protein MCGE09_00032 [Thaumarchaeota archaeon SCGC AB-539-E09]|nr:hypothetical protein MCGE09_00032 [Thaumarchaeota archaeon SCGC AB-539-E09]